MERVRNATFIANLARYVAQASKTPIAVTSPADNVRPRPPHDPIEFIVVAMSRLTLDDSHPIVELEMEELLWNLRCQYVGGRCDKGHEVFRVKLPRLPPVAFVSEVAYARFAAG